MIAEYAWRGGREALLRMGPTNGVTLLIVPPLFEEANRMRRLLVEAMRALAKHGLATVLPDLPGTNDSCVRTQDARLEDWRGALEAVAATLPGPCLTVAVRGGCLLDAVGHKRWRLGPVAGSSLLRDMVRATALTSGATAVALAESARTIPTRLAGNIIAPALYRALEAAEVTGDAHVAQLAGTPWRRAEPGDDPEFVAAVVGEILGWTVTCAAH